MRTSHWDLYTPVSRALCATSVFEWYRLPLDENKTILVVSVSTNAATLWVIGYTILVTMIFMAACELATLMILTFFPVGRSGTRHAMLVAYYNAGGPIRILPLMMRYIYHGLFQCQKGGLWAIDWSAVSAGCLLLSVAFSIVSGDMLTKFFVGGTALIQGNVAQVNPNAVFYPDFTPLENTGNHTNAIFDAYKGRGALAVYQAITRKTTTGYDILHDPSRIVLKETSNTFINTTARHPINAPHRTFRYRYELSGYELGLRDAPGLLIAVDGHCETFYGEAFVLSGQMSMIETKPDKTELVNAYPFPNRPLSELHISAHLIPIDRENFTAPWVYFHYDQTDDERLESGNWTFQLVPHTAYRLSRTQNTDHLDPWYQTEPNPEWDEEKDDLRSPYNAPYRVRDRRPPIRCSQRDTFTYNGASVNAERLEDLKPHGLKLSPFVQFVLEREFGIPVFARILGYVPIGSLASGIHYDPNEKRLDAARANISTDFRELVETAYVYSREVVRNTILLFPSLNKITDPEDVIENAARAGSNYSTVDRNDADFLLEIPHVTALSVLTLIVTPAVCVFLWIVVLAWTWAFNTQLKCNNNNAGRHVLRRSGLHATHLYLLLDEKLKNERQWSGRQTKAPFIRDLNHSQPDEWLASVNPESQRFESEAQGTPLLESYTSGLPPVGGEFSEAKLVQVSGFSASATPEEGNGIAYGDESRKISPEQRTMTNF